MWNLILPMFTDSEEQTCFVWFWSSKVAWATVQSHMLAVSVLFSICLAEDFPQRPTNPWSTVEKYPFLLSSVVRLSSWQTLLRNPHKAVAAFVLPVWVWQTCSLLQCESLGQISARGLLTSKHRAGGWWQLEAAKMAYVPAPTVAGALGGLQDSGMEWAQLLSSRARGKHLIWGAAASKWDLWSCCSCWLPCCSIRGDLAEPSLTSGAFSLLLKPIMVVSSRFCLLLDNWAAQVHFAPCHYLRVVVVCTEGRKAVQKWGSKNCTINFHHRTVRLKQINTGSCA